MQYCGTTRHGLGRGRAGGCALRGCAAVEGGEAAGRSCRAECAMASSLAARIGWLGEVSAALAVEAAACTGGSGPAGRTRRSLALVPVPSAEPPSCDRAVNNTHSSNSVSQTCTHIGSHQARKVSLHR
jgi:hypothetical protein